MTTPRSSGVLLTWLMRSLLRQGVPLHGFQFFGGRREYLLAHEGLSLLEAVDARRYRRVSRFIRGILASYSPRYTPQFDLCHLRLDLTTTAYEVAGQLVHEATHAYLMKRRGWPYSGDWKARQERLCVREQRRFARRYAETLSLSPEQRQDYLRRLDAFFEEELRREWWNRGRMERLREFLNFAR